VTPSPGTGLTPADLAYQFGFRAAAADLCWHRHVGRGGD
jgi:hypothetical protein